MSLPLLGSSYFDQPNYGGAVSTKTADLIAAEGDAMAKRIEAQSYQIDAKMLAPPITDLYSQAYQKIAVGDFTGFADMQKARSLAIGNPILMKTMDDADMIAGHLANTVVSGDKQQRSQEFQMKKQEDMQEFQLKKQGEMNEAIAKRQQIAQDRTDDRADDRQSESLFRIAHMDWEKEKSSGEKTYEDQQKLFKKQTAAWETQQAQGINSPKPEPPAKYEPRPEPKFNDFRRTRSAAPLPSQNLPSSQLDNNLDLPLPNDSITGAGATGDIPGSLEVASAPLTTPAPAATPTASTPSPVPTPEPTDTPEHLPPDATKPFGEQFSNRVAEGKPTANMVFGYDHNTGSGALITLQHAPAEITSTSTDTSTGKNQIDTKPSKEMENARDSLAWLNNTQGGQFGKWWAKETRLGGIVSISELPNPSGKGQPTYVARSGENTFIDKQGNTIPMAKEDYEAMKQVIKSANDGVLKYSFPDIPDKYKNYMRSQTISDAAKNPTAFNYEAANTYMKAHGIEPIKPEEVAAASNKIKEAAAKVSAESADKHLTERAQAELAKKGVPLPGQIKEDGAAQAQIANSSQRLREIPKEIESLDQQINAIKTKAGASPSKEQLDEMTELQKKIFRLENDAKEHNQILLRNSKPTPGFSELPLT